MTVFGKYKAECAEKAEAAGHEKRQKFLDRMHAGDTFGVARETVGLDFEAAMGTMTRAIKLAPWFSAHDAP